MNIPEFKVRVEDGNVYINDEFIEQLCYDESAVGMAIAGWLENN